MPYLYIYDMCVLETLVIENLQIGHCFTVIAHLRQHTKWPQGLKVASLSRSWQILHNVNSSTLFISPSIYESISTSLSSSNFLCSNSIM